MQITQITFPNRKRPVITTERYLPLADVVLPALAANDPVAAPRVALLVEKGPRNLRGQTLDLDGALIQIGRSQLVDLCFSLPSLSRLHAALSRTVEGGWLLHDLGSSNGTFVNGRRIDSVELVTGDEIALGPDLVLTLVDGGTPCLDE